MFFVCLDVWPFMLLLNVSTTAIDSADNSNICLLKNGIMLFICSHRGFTFNVAECPQAKLVPVLTYVTAAIKSS